MHSDCLIKQSCRWQEAASERAAAIGAKLVPLCAEPTRACTRSNIKVYGGARQVDARLDRRRKGVYGPPQGTRAVVFLDDLSMPLPEQYGAQVRGPHPVCQI